METAISIYNPDTRMMHIKMDDKVVWATAMLTRMHDMAGQNVDNKNLKLLVRELIRDLETRYKLLSMEEVEIIIGNGVRGDYGEYFGLSVASISKWFKAYIDSGAHNEYAASQVKKLNKLLPQKTGLTAGEIENIMIKGCIRCFNEYKTEGKFLDPGRANYQFLKEKGLIKLSDMQIKKYLADAGSEYKRVLEKESGSLNRDDAKIAMNILKVFKELTLNNPSIKSIAQYNAMADLFKSLVKKKKNIEDLLK